MSKNLDGKLCAEKQMPVQFGYWTLGSDRWQLFRNPVISHEGLAVELKTRIGLGVIAHSNRIEHLAGEWLAGWFWLKVDCVGQIGIGRRSRIK